VTDPIFLELEDVLLIHEEQLPRYGGSPGVATRVCWSLPMPRYRRR
jgi:hypothetical protein